MRADGEVAACPVQDARDDRKSLKAFEAQQPFEGSRVSTKFALAREILRSPDVRQAGGTAPTSDNPDHISFFFLDGDAHRKRRASVAGYFTPKAIVTRYHPLIQKVMEKLVGRLRGEGQADIGDLSFELAASVAFEIVGLTSADERATAQRIKTIMSNTGSFDRRPLHVFFNRYLFGWLHKAVFMYRLNELYEKDIAPAVEARRTDPRDDVISYMVKENYSKASMIMEVMAYGGAGIMTTREFIIMCAWQLFDHPDLKERFLTGDEEEQFAIIEEILRLDPLAAYLYRRTVAPIPNTAEGEIKEGELLAISLRAANWDESVAGECPYQLDPDRGKRMKMVGAYMSFGDGPHRCPGAQVALHETRIFLDHFMRVPGLRLISTPEVTWSLSNGTYEVRNAIVACDRAAG
jgi:cytochrome P450